MRNLPLLLPFMEFVAKEKIAIRLAHSKEQMDQAMPRIGTDKTRQRCDSCSGADQNQGRMCPIVRMETGIATQESADRIPGFQFQELAGA